MPGLASLWYQLTHKLYAQEDEGTSKLSTQCILCRHMTTAAKLCPLSSHRVDTFHVCAVTISWTYYVSWLHIFNSLRVHLSRKMLLLDKLIFAKIKKTNNYVFNCILECKCRRHLLHVKFLLGGSDGPLPQDIHTLQLRKSILHRSKVNCFSIIMLMCVSLQSAMDFRKY